MHLVNRRISNNIVRKMIFSNEKINRMKCRRNFRWIWNKQQVKFTYKRIIVPNISDEIRKIWYILLKFKMNSDNSIMHIS